MSEPDEPDRADVPWGDSTDAASTPLETAWTIFAWGVTAVAVVGGLWLAWFMIDLRWRGDGGDRSAMMAWGFMLTFVVGPALPIVLALCAGVALLGRRLPRWARFAALAVLLVNMVGFAYFMVGYG